MRQRPDSVPGLAVVGGAGLIWGLGLARLLAEACFLAAFFTSPVLVGLTALGSAALVVSLWRSASGVLPASQAIPLGLPALYVMGVVAGPLAGGTLVVGSAGLAGLGAVLSASYGRKRWLPLALLAAVTLALYLRTLLPSLGEADTLEFQVVAPKLGIAHPTGYPLYILLGRLFTCLPAGNVAWRLNLASAIYATAAGLVVFSIGQRLSDQRMLSLLGALAFALSASFWSQAIIAEVYTLHNLLTAGTLLLLLSREETCADDLRGEARRWHLVSFMLGLSLTNHLTAALLVPAVGLALLWDRPRLRARDWLVAGGLFLLGLSVYAFLLLRWPALHAGQWLTPREFVAYVTGGQFHGALRLSAWRDAARWSIVGRLLREPFGWAGLALAALGVAQLAARRRRELALTGVVFAAFLAYGLVYVVADIEVFLLPAHMILAVWMTCGAACLARLVSRSPRLTSPQRNGWIWRPGLAALYALIPFSRVWINLPAVDRSHDWDGYVWGRYALTRPLEKESAVLADIKKFAPLYYLQQVEGLRPDLDIVLLGSEELYQQDLRRRLAAGQTVYLARYLPHLEAFFLRSVGPLVQVLAEPKAGVRGEAPAHGGELPDVQTGIRLLGAEVDEDPLDPSVYHVTLHWQSEDTVADDLVVRLRLVDPTDKVQWIGEGRRPVGGLYPTNAWPVEVPVSDYHQVAIPAWLPRGTYSLEVGLSRPFVGPDVTAGQGKTVWWTLQRLTVEPPADPDPLPQWRLCSFGERGWLSGFDSPDEVVVSSSLLIDLAWRGVGVDERARLGWEVVAAERDPDATLELGEEPFVLAAGTERSRHVVTAPSSAGTYALKVRLVDGVAHCSWLAQPSSGCYLSEIRVMAGDEGMANFGDQILLVHADAVPGIHAPGDMIPVTLRWRGLRTIEQNYTVFVHLVGPDGRLHGQVDSWPVQGTYPTDRWTPGIEVTDSYEVRLASDAPPGPYRIEVGWYHLETMQRLSVVDGEGHPVADSFVVEAFEAQNK